MALKNAAPDGTTIALLPIALPVVVPLIVRDVAFDPLRDFAPVSQIASTPSRSPCPRTTRPRRSAANRWHG
jgi:tripartite-type tricarboxylate transporter receptor subunit TctC